MASAKEMPRRDKRVVYVDFRNELDATADDLEFGAWAPKGEDLTILCSNGCQKASVVESYEPEKISHVLCTKHPANMVPAASMCHVDVVDGIAGGKWPPPEPYALARPSGSEEISDGRHRKHKEHFNYAKALLRSDKELEKLSWKIRSEIHQSEMFELAVEAERAANAGMKSFSSRPSTYTFDILRKKHGTLKPGGIHSFSEDQFQHAAPDEFRKVRSFELRNVNDVIPQWKELHSHMRTHLFRKKVLESSLVFREGIPSPTSKGELGQSMDTEVELHDTAGRSIGFFGELAHTSIIRLKSHTKIESRITTTPANLKTVQDDEKNSGATDACQFGPSLYYLPTLYSAEWELNGHSSSIHSATGPSSSSYSEEAGIKPVTHGKRETKSSRFSLSRTTVDSQYSWDENHVNKNEIDFKQDDEVRLPGRFECRPNVAEAREMFGPGIKRTVALPGCYDVRSNEPISPSRSHLGRNYFAREEIKTPRPLKTAVNLLSEHDGAVFATPVGLRDIRARHTTDSMHYVESNITEQLLFTPRAASIKFEPSSIIEQDQSMMRNETTASPIRTQEALYLALPSISGNEIIQKQDHKVLGRSLTRKLHRPMAHAGNFQRENSEVCFSDAPGSQLVTSQIFTNHKTPTERRISSSRVGNSSSLANQLFALQDPSKADDHYDSYTTFEEKKDSERSLPRQNEGNQNPPNQYSLATHSGHDSNIFSPHLLEEPATDTAHPVIDCNILHRDFDTAREIRLSNEYDTTIRSLVPQSSTWGGETVVPRPAIKKALSWPVTTKRRRTRPGTIQLTRNLLAPNNSHGKPNWYLCTDKCTPTEKTFRNTSPTESHKMCDSFPQTEENLQVALEMMARLSPVPSAWRKEPYLAADKNTEFLGNYFYCTKLESSSSFSKLRFTEDQPNQGIESVCHNVGVDAVCNGFKFFCSREGAKTAIAKPLRQRAVSLDSHKKKGTQPSRWFDAIEDALERYFPDATVSDERSREVVQFEPPCLKKAANAGEIR